MSLPPPRRPRPTLPEQAEQPDRSDPAKTPDYLIGLVCLGNICRSPMADVVLRAKLRDACLDDRVRVASCGTGGWHVGNPMDDRAAATLSAAGYDPTRHRAQQIDAVWTRCYDLLLVMDAANLADVRDLAAADEDRPIREVVDRIALFRSFDPEGSGEVADPYYGGDDGFARVLEMVERTADALVEELEELIDD